jgi:hypothetical protein
LGYEAITAYVATDGEDILDSFVVEDLSINLDFVTDPRDTQMFGGL